MSADGSSCDAFSVIRDQFGDGREGPELIVLPAAAFWMGGDPSDPARSSAEQPQVEVTLPQPFAIGRYPITFNEYDAFCEADGRNKPFDFNFGRGDRPAINVSWIDANDYCAWLSAQTGAQYTLPCEAEWEYACRAGRHTPFSTGADITTAQANFDPADPADPIGLRDETTPVGAFEPNPWGLYDMHGNVGEWCRDRWSPTHDGADPFGAPTPIDLEDPTHSAVVRGGGWSTKKVYLRCSDRFHYAPNVGFEMVGFRVVRRLAPQTLEESAD